MKNASGFELISKEGIEEKTGETTPSKKLPLQLNSTLILYSVTNSAHRAKTKVLGAVENDFIMVERPSFSISDRLSAVVECDYMATYLHEGYLYRFRTRHREDLTKNIICLDYPRRIETIQLRKHRRIKVSVEAKFELNALEQPIRGFMKDISEGGCLLVLPAILHLAKGTPVLITFKLPDDQLVEKLQCTALNIQQVYIRQYTAIGMSFSGPPEELEKVRVFCEFCKRFRV
ncbi:MAG: PilZ domain-containing protein [Syntrophobacteraceae bacterium]